MHLVFVDSNRPGLAGMEAALRRGLRVSFVRCAQFESLYMSPAASVLLSRVHSVLTVEDSTDPDELERCLRKLALQAPIDGVIGIFQAQALPVAELAQRLGLPGARPAAVAAARDKLRCRRLLHEAGVPSTAYREVDNAEQVQRFAQAHGYPVIVKPATGVGKLLTQLLHDGASVENYFGQLAQASANMAPVFQREVAGRMIVEQHLAGPLFSVEIGAHNGRFTTFMVSQRKRTEHDEIVELGTTMPAGLAAEEKAAVCSYVEWVLEVLGLDLGIFHVELILTAQGPRLVEVNPRLMGGNMPELYALATGEDIFDHLIDIHLGHDPQPRVGPGDGVATSRTIAGRCNGRVRADLPADWLDEFRPEMARCNVQVRAGQEVQQVTDNFGTYGFFQVKAPSHAESVARADALVQRIAQRLGVRLAT
jgi:predicted ATP-grasp superfamily ATP-dependent carboligase